jgi:hypothetical protein
MLIQLIFCCIDCGFLSYSVISGFDNLTLSKDILFIHFNLVSLFLSATASADYFLILFLTFCCITYRINLISSSIFFIFYIVIGDLGLDCGLCISAIFRISPSSSELYRFLMMKLDVLFFLLVKVFDESVVNPKELDNPVI